jgi:diguanylate cyclase (GGDEF)-like protein/PAS domain S-box-containing protein
LTDKPSEPSAGTAARDTPDEAQIARALLDARPEATLAIDDTGRVRLANASAAELFGYSGREIEGRPVTELLPQLAGDGSLATAIAAVSGATRALSMTGRRLSGDEFAASVSAEIAGEAGAGFLVIAVHDLAAARARRRATWRASRMLRSAFAGSPVGMALIALDGSRLLHVNQALCEIVGFREDDLLAVGLDEITHVDDLGIGTASLSRLMAGEVATTEVQQRYYHRRGHPIWVSVSTSLARDDDGTPRHLISVFQDISRIKATEAALREANNQLQAIFDHAPAWMTLRALDGRFLNANDHLIRSLGTTREELIGSHPGTHLDPAIASAIHADDHQVWETRAPLTGELDIPNLNGETHTYQVVRYPVLDDQGEVSALGSFALDITDRTRAAEARERALDALEEAQRIARLGSWTWDPSTGTASWSRQMYRNFGLDPDGPKIDAQTLFVLAAPADRKRMMKAWQTRFGGDERFEVDYTIVGPDGAERSLHLVGRQDDDGRLSGTCQDVTELRAAEREVRVAEERFRKAFEHAPVGMALLDLDQRFVKVNDALCAMLGYRPEDLLETSATAITHPEDRDLTREQAAQLMRGEIESFHREKRLLRAVGEPIWVAQHLSLLRGRDGEPLQFVQQVVDVTERRRLETELRHLADHDPLTGLLNRRGLEAELERQVGHVNRYGDRGALLVLDLDHFKTVNDTLGHEAGDQLIVAVAGILEERLRESDTVARLGGDEFAILLPEADLESAQDVAQQLVADIHEHAIVSAGQVPRHVSASVGVTTFQQGITSGEEVLVSADLAMYEAKEAGRGRLAVNAPDRSNRSRSEVRRAWVERLQEALDGDQLTLVAQPLVAIGGGELFGHELFLRMIESSGDAIPPGAFLYIAERYDLVQELDRWVAVEAIRLLGADHRRPSGPRLGTLGVNISARSLGDEELLRRVAAELDRGGVDPALLVFELSESAAVANIQQARRFSQALEQIGCRFALDDFGAGFGSFYYLKHIPFDLLKIDGELVSGCRTNRTDQLVIESLVAIARGLGKRTVAKGVEEAETRAFLAAAGVDLGQGYHFGHPAPLPGASDLAAATDGQPTARDARPRVS